MALETKKNIVGKLVPNAVPKSQQKEKEREDNAWKKKLFGYLEGFKKSFAALEGAGGDKKKGGLFSGLLGMVKKLFPAGMLALIPAALMGMVGTLGIGVLVLGGILAIVQRVKDAFGGWAKAEAGEWGNVDKISGWIGGFLGGKGSGLWNALMVGGTWAVTGMMAGIAFGPPGIIIGGIIGAVIGGILGWIGGQKIAEWVDGTVKKLRSIFDLPESLSEEQKVLAEKEVAAAKEALMKAADNISMYKKELANEATTYQRRIELRRLIAAEEKIVEDKKDIIRTESRRLAESKLGDMDKELKAQQQSTLAASMEVQRATELKNQAWLKTIWTKAIHGEGSKEHLAAVAEYDDRVLAVSDAKKNLEENKTQMATMRDERKKLRIELDKEHRTAMGNVRLFFAGETDWQNNLKSGWTNMMGTIKTWFKDNIYDPGSTGGPPGTDTPLRIFGVEMKWPKLSFPSWQEIKAALPWWLGGGGKEGGVTKVFKDHFEKWKWDLPSWEDAKKQMPKWLGGTVDAVEKAGAVIAGVAGVFGDAFSEWKLDVPSWEETQKALPKWLGGTGSVGETVDLAFDTFKNWKFVLPKWEDVKKELPWWLGGGIDATKTALQAFKDEFADETTWTFKIPSWATIKALLPKWLGGTKGTSLAEDVKPMASWTFTLPGWKDIKKSLPWWLGGGDDAKTKAQMFEDIYGADLGAWTFTLPTWADISKSIPTWLGGTKGDKTPSQLAEATFGDWKFEFPTWKTIEAWLPDWIKDPVGWIKGIFKKGDDAADAEEQVRDRISAAEKRTARRGELGGDIKQVQMELEAARNARMGDDRFSEFCSGRCI